MVRAGSLPPNYRDWHRLLPLGASVVALSATLAIAGCAEPSTPNSPAGANLTTTETDGDAVRFATFNASLNGARASMRAP